VVEGSNFSSRIVVVEGLSQQNKKPVRKVDMV